MPKKIRVCQGPHCSYRKSNRILDALRSYFSKQQTETIDLDFCACTGFCEEGPNVVVDDVLLYRYASTDTIGEKISQNKGEKLSEARPLDINLDDDMLPL